MRDVDQDEGGAVHAAVRVFLLDDHEMVRLGLREMLEQSGDITVVGEAARADEALRRAGCAVPGREACPGALRRRRCADPARRGRRAGSAHGAQRGR